MSEEKKQETPTGNSSAQPPIPKPPIPKEVRLDKVHEAEHRNGNHDGER